MRHGDEAIGNTKLFWPEIHDNPSTKGVFQMNILETMLSAGDSGVVKQLASQFGVNSEQATSVVSTLLPALAGGLKEKIAHGDTSGYRT